MTKAPATIIYASVESREMVRIALMPATHNDLEAKLGNTLNVYVQTPLRVLNSAKIQGKCNDC